MPVITRAAALLLQSTGGTADWAYPLTTDQSSSQSKPSLVNITTTKNRSKKKKQQPILEQTTTPIVIQGQQSVSNLTGACRSISPTSPSPHPPLPLTLKLQLFVDHIQCKYIESFLDLLFNFLLKMWNILLDEKKKNVVSSLSVLNHFLNCTKKKKILDFFICRMLLP